ncbi:MAG: transcriptional regulator [Planctomycetia bacterium]|nr:transcriptional regulator [Planctomycetia bacterium]
MSRGDQLTRQWELLRTLQTRGTGIPLRELSERFGVSERTIQRDFEMLQELGFPIEHDQDECGKRFWRMPHDFFRSGPLVISLTEAVALHLAEESLAPLTGTHLADGVAGLIEKVHQALPPAALAHFAKLDEILHVRLTGQTDYAAKAEIIRTLEEAARESLCVEITYRALWRGQQYTTRCDPLGLVLYDGDLYLVAHSHRAGALRVFKAARILAASKTTVQFERPEGFRLEDHFRSSFGIIHATGRPIEIAVRFTGTGAALVEERLWHQSQRLNWLEEAGTLFEHADEEPDNLVATFQLGDVVEFKRWILGFGPQAEVLRPDWLRAEIHHELNAAAEQYRGKS